VDACRLGAVVLVLTMIELLCSSMSGKELVKSMLHAALIMKVGLVWLISC
jgi:hypothetical protein